MRNDSGVLDRLRPLFESMFAVDSTGSIVLRFVIWSVVAITIIASVDTARPEHSTKNLKGNLGLLLLFLCLSCVMIWLLFGFIPAF